MNNEYQNYMNTMRDEEADQLKNLTELAQRLKTEFGISTDMENPDASHLNTPPCEWYTEVQDQTPDQLDSLTIYLEELASLAREAAQAASMLSQIRENIKNTKPEDFED